jgi:quercetin dioxygenase-like cupin family protein
MKRRITWIVSGIVVCQFLLGALQASEEKVKSQQFQPTVVKRFLDEAKKNKNWKTAFLTGGEEQIVFMNISPLTNPNNEIGNETHPFDQVIFIVEGNGKAIVNDNPTPVTDGDLIFIPKGTAHNVVNLDKENELKVVSFYSKNDIPKNAVYQRKADEPTEAAQ